ncbi:uncharacterized protein [Maniola hyperantus]|uniref:uncharacterized protein isoform X1 n=2 Tax=Aphantopus hyperantus TaxID=2795564 RepID=UPI00156A5C51|nr:uncharacterized protein LOC117993560 isoform X1 [Maniola hyperantus]
MAVTRRNYIFGAFISSVLCVILTIVAISSDSWIVSSASAANQEQDSTVRYGMFRGEFALYIFATPSYNTLYMTCIPEMNACAISCKTEAVAREEEVRALASGYRTNQACIAVTTVDTTNPLEVPPVISFGVYVGTLFLLFLKLMLAVLAASLAILNATRNPTEPVFGLPGCLWTNVATTILGLTVMLMFGIYWATSSLKDHLAFSFIALGGLTPSPGLGYSYWLLIGAIICSVTNVVLIELRKYLLERDPPPPTIKLENHSDGSIFLY